MRLAAAAVVLAAVMKPGRTADPPEPIVLKGHTKAVTTVAWYANGKAMATAGDDRGVGPGDRDVHAAREGTPGVGWSVGRRSARTAGGWRLATAGADKLVRVWNAKIGKELAALSCPDRVEMVASSLVGKSLAGGSKDGSVRIRAVPAKGRCVQPSEHPSCRGPCESHWGWLCVRPASRPSGDRSRPPSRRRRSSSADSKSPRSRS